MPAEAFRDLGSTAVSDALDRLGLDADLGSFERFADGAIAGPALTVELGPARADDPPAGRHLAAGALARAVPGTVIVLANGGRRDAAAWGGLLAQGAAVAGVAGVIVDGAIRDVDDVEAAGVPVFARGTTPRSARGRVCELATGRPVTVAGCRIAPGDWIVADRTGVVAVPAGELTHALDEALRIAAAEERFADEIARGRPPSEVLDRRYEEMLRRD